MKIIYLNMFLFIQTENLNKTNKVGFPNFNHLCKVFHGRQVISFQPLK